MKLKNRLLILIITIAIASTLWVPAFAVTEQKDQITDAANHAVVPLQAEAAIVMDAETGKILYEKDAYTPREPASVTKIVTCLVALDHLEMDQQITVKSNGNPTGNVINVKAGEVFTAEQLIYALMLPSANDAAVALAEEIGGSQEAFCQMMNKKAADCGAKNTNFMNPNGLNWPGHEAHLTTAYDLAVITREAMKNETFRKIVSTLTYDIPATNMSEPRHLVNTNKFLWDDDVKAYVADKMAKQPNPEPLWVPEPYEGVLGVKTGTTSTAGACFVGALDAHGTELIAVVLHSGEDERYKDTEALWNYTISTFYDTHVMAAKGEPIEKVRVKRGAVRKVEAAPEMDAVITVPKGESVKKVKTKTELDELRAPVKKGQVVGTVRVYDGDEVVCERNLIAASNVEEGGFLSIFGVPDKLAPVVYIILILLAAVAVVFGRMMHLENKKRRARRERRSRGA